MKYWSFNGADKHIEPLIAHYLEDLSRVWTAPPTRLCQLMTDCGSNKADRVYHPYSVFYDALLAGIDARFVFEIGIGSQDPSMAYSMESRFVPGGSLRAWRDYFSGALVFGADYDSNVLFSENRIETFYANQRDPESIREMWKSIRQKTGYIDFDLIVDDAVHEPYANELLFNESIEYLRFGGWYFIEDHLRDSATLSLHLDFAKAQSYPALVIDFTQDPNSRVNACFTVINKR